MMKLKPVPKSLVVRNLKNAAAWPVTPLTNDDHPIHLEPTAKPMPKQRPRRRDKRDQVQREPSQIGNGDAGADTRRVLRGCLK
eukprot:3001917-Karenia_brevis.AAC.1